MLNLEWPRHRMAFLSSQCNPPSDRVYDIDPKVHNTLLNVPFSRFFPNEEILRQPTSTARSCYDTTMP
ncbi:hypothetical protein M413DRAFT_352276 [Hebeloma cylindrosporum]|uniref:Uncharacterized protein n=1 Tax=Hebeloma cylindrosporum TaxID=76867 RepID=A0A0C2YTP5_HEBCY|nr:hypothetical protein M413DRAFT_352276 [Hebeloma cylindrosporum h7]